MLNKTSIYASALALVFSSSLIGSMAMANDCILSIDRTACPGKETEAFKPYAGKNPTEEKVKAADAGACVNEAQKAAKIIRKGTLSKKVVTAKFGGKDAGTKEDSKPCN